MIDFSDLIPKRKPTRKEKARFNRWVHYLKNSKLTTEQIYNRAASFTEQRIKIPND